MRENIVVLPDNFSCLSLATTSDQEIQNLKRFNQELLDKIATMNIQGISQFIALIYILYFYLCAVI